MRKIILFASVMLFFAACAPTPNPTQDERNAYPVSTISPTVIVAEPTLTPSPPTVTATEPILPLLSPANVPDFWLVAGDGFLINDAGNNALLPSRYQVKNEWVADWENKKLSVIAGALRNAHPGEQSFAQPWPGLLIIRVWDRYGNVLKDERGEYFTPIRVGAVQIVDAIGIKLYLVAEDGTAFVFDVATREYLSEAIPSQIIIPTMPTPTQTLTPGPTITAFPTLNRYP